MAGLQGREGFPKAWREFNAISYFKSKYICLRTVLYACKAYILPQVCESNPSGHDWLQLPPPEKGERFRAVEAGEIPPPHQAE